MREKPGRLPTEMYEKITQAGEGTIDHGEGRGDTGANLESSLSGPEKRRYRFEQEL